MADIKCNTRKSPLCKNLTGKQFNRWTVLGLAGFTTTSGGNKKYRWLCKCMCGTLKCVYARDIISQKSKSCGCFRKEWCTANKTTHGLSTHSLYSLWINMIYRCTNPNNAKYSEYGGRGIKVCDRWLLGDDDNAGIVLFITDVEPRPSPKHSLDRIDNNKGYSPDNCRWATQQEQLNNTRTNRNITYKGITQSLAAWSRATGIGWMTLDGRLKTGWPIDLALETPILAGSTRRPK